MASTARHVTHWEIANSALERLTQLANTTIEAARDLGKEMIRHSVSCAIALAILQNQQMFLEHFLQDRSAVVSVATFVGSVHLVIESEEIVAFKSNLTSDLVGEHFERFPPRIPLDFIETSWAPHDGMDVNPAKWIEATKRLFPPKKPATWSDDVVV